MSKGTCMICVVLAVNVVFSSKLYVHLVMLSW